ncbi:lmo0937 family membrane protein [Aureibaculum sp. A20]|uniref:Lmo0937 family membrane protein n=1 Tax=Aureibaculum flavum TaxID=2795986 RepID=A0ABS0WQU4_9FLAO|nr:lmo0937 family membrane protein [Aureibaculum flavum]MBJ2174353.1 lmo0937 family membrane protein [Aureibaculum flavum]
MSKLLYGLAIIFLIVWAIGFFAYGLGLIIHIFLLGAVVAMIIKLTKEK